MSSFYDPLIDYLTGDFPHKMELTILGHAFWGAMAVKDSRNKNGELHWFHAFVLTVVTGFAGGLFNFMWMGKPTAMISNDVVFASCMIAFAVVNWLPFDLGYKFCSFLPVKIVITMFAQLFRSLGMAGFITGAFNHFEESPSAYYPIPVFGPIWYGVMLGNMGGLFSKGINAYLANGIPWPFQNGMFCAPFFHFYAHDTKGPIGELLRSALAPVQALLPGVDDRTFAIASVSLFMQVVGVLQLPAFLGGSFSPFVAIHNLINSPVSKHQVSGMAKEIEMVSPTEEEQSVDYQQTKGKKKPKRKKNKQKKS